MNRLLLIGLGGALGTLARYGLTIWSQEKLGTTFPYGTLAINLIGSFLLAAIVQVSLTTDLLSPTVKLALGTGVMGGFTTYSTFSYDTFKFFHEGAWLEGVVNALVTVVGCLLATLLGFVAAQRYITG